jgi:hypothetical protein
MSSRRFIKLANLLLNTNSIRRVWIDPQEFQIELNQAKINGFLVSGSGSFSSDNDVIKINKVKHPQAYKDLENWVQETILSNN